MAWTGSLKVHGRCPKHPRFNPEAGMGAIKAGCCWCYRLWELYRAFHTLRKDMTQFNDSTVRRRP
jgi:hypothetical protein